MAVMILITWVWAFWTIYKHVNFVNMYFPYSHFFILHYMEKPATYIWYRPPYPSGWWNVICVETWSTYNNENLLADKRALYYPASVNRPWSLSPYWCLEYKCGYFFCKLMILLTGQFVTWTCHYLIIHCIVCKTLRIHVNQLYGEPPHLKGNMSK